MSLTIGLTGMDPATETALKSALMGANARLDSQWRLLPEGEADHIVVDMDSMYGPMSWLRLHAAGKKVIGLTSAPRTQADFRLGRPFDEAAAAVLLSEIAAAAGIDLKASATGAPATPQAKPPQAPAGAPPAAPGLGQAPQPEPAAGAIAPESAATAIPDNRLATAAEPPAPVAAPPEPPRPEPTPPAPPPPPRERTLFDWLAPGQLSGRLRYERPSGPMLLIDADAGTYHGPAALKPLAQYFDGPVEQAGFAPVDAAGWERDSAAAGAAQPLARLAWLGGLLAGKGRLLPGHDPDGRYQLTRWSQTEREFPRHFRIATAMMKGPATLADIAAASGVPVEDVADFVNANLATGAAEFVPEPPPAPVEPPKPSGLLGRLRGK